MVTSPGLHHVSAITSDAHRNHDFYTRILGLRLVKQSVNFDDPDVLHLWYGDEAGSPGSLLTFFVWPGSNRGQQGVGQVATTSFAIDPTAIGFWIERLLAAGIRFEGPARRSNGSGGTESVLSFRDPDGLMLELVTHPGAQERPSWSPPDGIDSKHAIHGLHSVTLWVDSAESTDELLRDELGFRELEPQATTRRFVTGEGSPSQIVDVRAVGGFVKGTEGAGTVHHVAWSVEEPTELVRMRDELEQKGYVVSDIIDRHYFQALYARQAEGILHEFATLAPGFTVDEDLAHLGERLIVPHHLEASRDAIETRLPPVQPVPSRPASSMFAQVFEDIPLSYTHRFIPAKADSSTVLLLLHGTGGDEHSLIDIGTRLAPGAALLSPAGNVMEGQSRRFFARYPDGSLDQEDLARRTDELVTFIDEARERYDLAEARIIAVGFSNGANIAASLLLRHPGALRGAILLSPMLPFIPQSRPDLRGTDVFIGAGRTDPLVPVSSVEQLASTLTDAGASVDLYWEAGGHEVTSNELRAATVWLAGISTRS